MSTTEQHTGNQQDVLRAWAAEQGLEVAAEFVTEDSAWHANGNGTKGRKFDKAREDLLAGAEAGHYTVVLVWALDRLSRRGYDDLGPLLAALRAHGCELRSHQEQWLATVGPFGEIVIHIFAWMAEQESARRSERTRAGLEAARAKGHKGGRKPALSEGAQLDAVADFDAGKPKSVIAAERNISRAALDRVLRKHGRIPAPAGSGAGGRPPITAEQRAEIVGLLRDGKSYSATERATGISRATITAVWREDGDPGDPPGAGRGAGRPFATKDEQVRLAMELIEANHSVAEIARLIGQDENTLNRAIERVYGAQWRIRQEEAES